MAFKLGFSWKRRQRDDGTTTPRALKFGFGRPRPVATGAERIAPRIARPAGRRAAMERGVSSAEGVGTVNGGSAVDDEMDEMQFSGTSRLDPANATIESTFHFAIVPFRHARNRPSRASPDIF